MGIENMSDEIAIPFKTDSGSFTNEVALER
jgi:hypothetical protein